MVLALLSVGHCWKASMEVVLCWAEQMAQRMHVCHSTGQEFRSPEGEVAA